MTRSPDVLRDFYIAYNDHDVEAVVAMYAEDGVHTDVATARPNTGRAAIADGLSGFLGAFPDARWAPSTVLEGRGTSFGRYVLTGTLQRDMWGMRANRQPLRLPGVHVLEIGDDDLIRRSEDYWDAGTFQRQMSSQTIGENA